MKNTLRKTISLALAVTMAFGSLVAAAFVVPANAQSEYEVGDTVTFGSYPQTRVTDEATLEQLNSVDHWWHFYDYCYGTGENNSMTKGKYMLYADSYIGDEKYRGVIIKEYRPGYTDEECNAENSFQDDNGYVLNYVPDDFTNAYWFRYEPLEWIVVNADEMLLMSKDLIDSQPYNSRRYLYPLEINTNGAIFYSAFADEDMRYRANRYDVSSIREWLNDEFYNTAFNAEQKTHVCANAFAKFHDDYDDTLWSEKNPAVHDYVALPSLSDLTVDGVYGNTSSAVNNMLEIPGEYTDYALSQGLEVSTEEGREGEIWWWTRKESSGGAGWVICVQAGESVPSGHLNTDATGYGIRPVIKYTSAQDVKKLYVNTYDAGEGTFLLSGDSVWEQNVVEGMATEEIKPPVREGYVFAGWEDESGNLVEIPDTMGTEHCEYYARWEDASALQSDETLRIETKLYRYDGNAGDWIETEKAAVNEIIKARVFVDTSYYTNKGSITVFYANSRTGGFYTASNLTANPDPESFAAKNGLVCTQAHRASDMLDNGLITEWYDENYNYIVVDYTFDTEENRKISGDDWLFEFEIKVSGAASKNMVETPESTVLNPYTAQSAITDVPVGAEGGTAADNVSLADINVKKELIGNGITASCLLTFDPNGGTMQNGSTEVYSRRSGIGRTVPDIIVERDDFIFVGWRNESGETVTLPKTFPYEDENYTAVWVSRTQEVNYYLFYGSEPYKTEIYGYGDAITYAVPDTVPDGMTFIGWADANGDPLPETMGLEPIDAYAVYEINSYNATFCYSQGGALYDAREIPFGSVITPPEAPVAEGMRFKGWADAEGNYLDGDYTMPAGDAEFYAVWEMIEYTVSYKIGEETKEYTAFYNAEVPTPDMSVYENMEFLAWLDADGNETEIPAVMPSNDLEFTASFRYSVKVEGFDLTVTYDEDCFDKDFTMHVDELEGESRSGSVLVQGSASYRQVGIFDIKMLDEKDEVVQPVGGKKVTLRFPIPESLSDRNEFVITHWFTSGGRERFFTEDGTIKIEDGYLVIQVGKFSEFEIHVKSGATVSVLPERLSFNYKEDIDIGGIELTIVNPDGSVEKVTDTSKITVSGYDSRKIGKQTVTVEYEDEVALIDVSVSYAWWQWIIRIFLLGFLWY